MRLASPVPPAWLAACAPQLVLACALAFASDGVYHDDDLTHYLMARWSWTDPVYLLHDWGRPGFTIPYAAVAWVGDYACGLRASRFLSLAIALASALLACATARALGVRRAWLAGPCLLAMPLYFRLSYTMLTETVCGLYLIGGSWLLASGRPRRAALVLALAPLARHEAVVFLALACVCFGARRDWVAIALLGWAEAAWNVTGALGWYWMLPIRRYFEAKPILGYGEGGTFHYALMWGLVATPVLAAASLAGAALVLRRVATVEATVTGAPRSPLRRLIDRLAEPRVGGALLVAGGALAMVLVQTALYARNTYASGGYPRFLVPAGPWMAALAALAIDVLLDMRRGGPSRAARGVALTVALAVALLPLARAHAHDAHGMIRGLYHGVSGECLDRLALPFAALGLACAARPGRRMVGAFLAVGLAWVAIEWGGSLERLSLNERQRAVADAVAAAQRDAAHKGVAPDVWCSYPSSPWVAYFAQRASRASSPSVGERWRASRADAPLYLILDTAYDISPSDRAEIFATPPVRLYASRLRGDDTFAVDVYVRR